MLMSKDFLIKYASKQSNNFGGNKVGNDVAEKERELIRRAQSGDFMALKQLQMDYRGVISNAVSKSGLNSVMDYNSALQEGNRAFKELVTKNFDVTKDNKPSTYIIGQLPNYLKGVKYNNRDFAARKSEELSMQSEAVSTARNFLKKELGRDPSVQETFNFVQTNLRTGKSLTMDKIKRIDALDRRELSGNQQIGGTDSSQGASFITLSDLENVADTTPEQIYQTGLKNQRIESIINQLPRMERRLVRNFYQLGEFKGTKKESLSRVATNNNMTYYEAQKILDKMDKMLRDEGIL